MMHGTWTRRRAMRWLLGGGLVALRADGRAQTTGHCEPDGGAAAPRERWRVPGAMRGLPAIDESTVYVLGRDHQVIAVDPQTGQVRWRAATGGHGATANGERVVVAGGSVVAGDDGLEAFSRSSGTLRWRIRRTGGAYALGPFLGGASAGVVYAGGRGGGVHAIDADTGAVRWSVRLWEGTGLSTVFPPVIAGDALAAAYTAFTTPPAGGVALLDRLSGHVRWHLPLYSGGPVLDGSVVGGPIVVDGVVVVACGDGSVLALSHETGRPTWHAAPLPPRLVPTGRDSRPLVAAGRLVVAGSTSGVVTAYDRASGEERWRSTTAAGSVAFALSAAAGTVYVPYVGGRLAALDARTGVERWHVGDQACGFIWPPLVHDGTVYAAASGSGLHAWPERPPE